MEYVDWYCERMAPGFWGEPLNAVSNLAFVFAAIALFLSMRGGRARYGRTPFGIALLGIELVAIGIFSGALHTTATALAGALDDWSIRVFILTYLVVFAHWMWGVPWSLAWLAVPVYAAASVGALWLLETAFGEAATLGGYLPAILSQVGLVASVLFSRDAGKRVLAPVLGLATVTLVLAITARTIDDTKQEQAWEAGREKCDLPLNGTHFLWHTFAGLTLFLMALALLRRVRQAPSGQFAVVAAGPLDHVAQA